MSEQYLSCNLRNCGKRLKEQAYVTSCSHIFCVEHGQRALKNNSPAECMVCGTKIDKQYDFVLINLNPTDQYKSVWYAELIRKKKLHEKFSISDDTNRITSRYCTGNSLAFS